MAKSWQNQTKTQWIPIKPLKICGKWQQNNWKNVVNACETVSKRFENTNCSHFMLGEAHGVAGPVLKLQLWPFHTWKVSGRGRPSFETETMAPLCLEGGSQAHFWNSNCGYFILRWVHGVAGPVLKQKLWLLYTWRVLRCGRWQSNGKYYKTISKPWQKHGKTMINPSKPWQNNGRTMAKPW